MKIAPKLIRDFVYRLIGPRFYENLRYLFYYRFVKHAGYDRAYYDGGEMANSDSYDLLAKTLMAEFRPHSLVDVGCGNGGISEAFMRHGCKTVAAFDGSKAAVELARERGVTNVQQIDFIQVHDIPASGELCICCEVAEHIPEKYAAHFCKLLSQPAPILAFTAASPGQGGHLHVNLKPQSWWIDLMLKFGMQYDAASVKSIRLAYGGKMTRDYDSNLMIFRRVRGGMSLASSATPVTP